MSSSSSIKSVVSLSNGQSMPSLGWGTWKLPTEEALTLLPTALSQGYRHIDCAAVYLNEQALGTALSSVLCPSSSTATSTAANNALALKREELFVVSKLWNTQHRNVLSACKRSLHDWQLSYFDLFLIHWPLPFLPDPKNEHIDSVKDSLNRPILDKNVTLEETWKQMEQLVDTGLTKAIGVSNFTVNKLKRILAIARHKPAVLQVELHPYLQQSALVKFCQEQGIAVVAYSPLGSTKLPLLQDPVIKAVSESESKRQGTCITPAQVCLLWNLSSGRAVIPKSSNPDRMAQNLSTLKLQPLSEESMTKITEIGKLVEKGEYKVEAQVIDLRKARTCDPMKFWAIDCFGDDD